jgi:hypothetical protein
MTFVCNEGTWRADLLRMMENYSRTWGADANGLVGCSQNWQVNEAFWKLIEAVDPDHFAAFQHTIRGLGMADPGAYEVHIQQRVAAWTSAHGGTDAEARLQFENETYLSCPLDGLPAPDEIERRIRSRLAPLNFGTVSVTRGYRANEAPPHGAVDMCQLTYRPKRVTTINHAALPNAVRLLVASATGDLSPSHLQHLTANSEVEHVVLDVDASDVALLLEYCWTGTVDMLATTLASALQGGGAVVPPEFASPEFTKDTPLNHARLGCQLFRVVEPSTAEMPVVILAGESADDFSYAFTRRHVCGDTYWLPTHPEPEDAELHRTIIETFAKVLSRLYSTSPTGNRRILLSSLTLSRDELDVLFDELCNTVWGSRINSDGTGEIQMSICDPMDIPVRRSSFLLDGAHPNDSLSEPFSGANLERDLDIPLPSEAVGLRPDTLRWQVDIEASGHMLPTRSALHPLLCVGSHEHWATRSSKYGISVDSHGRTWSFTNSPLSQLLVRLRLRLPPPEEIFRTLLAEFGATLEISDKGRYSERMLELWGGLDKLAADLRSEPTNKLLNYWIAERQEEDLGRVHQGRRYLTLAAARAITTADDEECRVLLDRYLHNEIVNRGFVLQCPLCRACAFYPTEDVGSRFQCLRCRRSNEILSGTWRETLEPEWYYALDEVVYQGLINNASVPLLAMSELATDARSFLHMPEAKIQREGQPDVEIDLWTIVDGAITLGEAKKETLLATGASREVARCNLLRDLLRKMTADTWVMATASDDWSERTKTNVNTRIGAATQVRWLTALR